MQKPEKLTSDKLKHPADRRSAWNGDKIRPRNDFMSRGVRSVSGTKEPPGLVRNKPVPRKEKS